MEIERINENTVKFYISYIDIEDRGFKREEIWYNREKSEQLFWQMMEEVNYKEDFTVEGPLWIQVQALEKGLEIVVTKAQISKSGENLVLPTHNDSKISKHTNDEIETLLNDKFGNNSDQQLNPLEVNNNSSLIVQFNHFEDVIQLSHYSEESMEETINTLYYYEDTYYLYVEFLDVLFEETEQENLISQIYEFANEADITVHLLEEYGNKIFENDTISQVKSYFPA